MRRKIMLIIALAMSFNLIMNTQAKGAETESKIIDPNLEPIVKSLLSENDDDFWTGIDAACILSERGSNKGVLAIQEAIIRKSANNDCKFFEPGIVVRTVEEQKESENKLITLAKEQSLLKDTYNSGNLISAYYSFYGDQKIGDLSERIKAVGGKEQYRAFILLFNDMWCFIQVNKNK